MTGADPGGSHAEPTEAMTARVRASIAKQGMMAALGVELIGIERGRVELGLRHDDRFTQQHGSLHAGAVAAVLDSACGYAAYSVMRTDASVLTPPAPSTCSRPRPGSASR
jgi:acyl-coenzyme A thioesterase PaaI-like protein